MIGCWWGIAAGIRALEVSPVSPDARDFVELTGPYSNSLTVNEGK